MKTSDKLLLIRAELDMSQTALANELKVSFTTINRWENEKTTPSRRYLMLIDAYARRNGVRFDED